jgi:GNAT superfamily N-acetyltransferase
MLFREARVADIAQMAAVRLSVTENVLSDPALITPDDYEVYLAQRGKGWVCEKDGAIVGFAVADLMAHNIWALFVQPGWEGKGIGRQLQYRMLQWYFSQTKETVWLGTAPHSRAETFYRKSGWKETGRTPNGEIRFEMTYDCWQQIRTFSNAHT